MIKFSNEIDWYVYFTATGPSGVVYNGADYLVHIKTNVRPDYSILDVSYVGTVFGTSRMYTSNNKVFSAFKDVFATKEK